MQSIRELVKVDDKARFRSDVQLSLFDDPQENLALLESFIFSAASPGSRRLQATTQVSSTEFLNQLIEAYISDRVENRFVAIANYGHGKSHLALALANYFSRPTGSAEVETVLDKLDRALNEPARSARYRDFKESRGEFLVIRLRGDTPSSLREQFLPALEKALQEHPATQNARPPLWHDYAEELLRSLTPEEQARANQQLAPRHTDVPSLLLQVRERRDVRDLCIEALKAAKGMTPDLGAQLSLRDTLEWVADNLCGEGKPLGGALVMMDEFSLYISSYAQRGAVGELQDLLNGISNRPSKLLFLALAQHDPLTMADNVALSDHARDTLKHELTRIPKKLSLYSQMESVINAYLKQSNSSWIDFIQEMKIQGALTQAGVIAFDSFQGRYGNTLHWLPDEFDARITKGCFPLHPLTTALLCNLKFNTSVGMGDPRTVLGFVLEHMRGKLDQPAIVADQINWVLPVELVDYFEASLSPEVFLVYRNAVRNLGSKTNDTHQRILQGLLLQEAAELSLVQDKQLDFLAESAGLPMATVEKLLPELRDSNVIRHDSIKKSYSFWPASADPDKLKRLLRKRLEGIRFDFEQLQKLNKKISNSGYDNIDINVAWGNAKDWAAEQHVLTKEFCNVSSLQDLVQPFTLTPRGVDEGKRGVVVWLLARSEEDIRWYQENTESILEQVINRNTLPPLLLVLPQMATPNLFNAFARVQALESINSIEKRDVGDALYKHENDLVNRTLDEELRRAIGDTGSYATVQREVGTILSPLSYRSAILSQPNPSLMGAITTAYQAVYRTVPSEFFTQYRLTTSSLRNAVKQVAGFLFTGGGIPLTTFVSTNSGPPSDLVHKYLVQKWGLLSGDHISQRPTDIRLKQAWNVLETSFAAGAKEVSVVEPLVRLINAPHGYDYNTVILLFSAWYGYHNYDLELRQQGRLAKHTVLSEYLQKGSKDFIQNLKSNSVTLTRRNPDDARREVRAILDRPSREPFSEAEVESVLTILDNFVADQRNSEREREDARTRAGSIREAAEMARQYKEQVAQIQRQIDNRSNFRGLLNANESIKKLPRVTLISVNAPEPSAIQSALNNAVERCVDEECQLLTRPTDVTQVGLYEQKLNVMGGELKKAGYTQLEARIQSAVRRLQEKVQELQKRQSEDSIRAEIQGISLTVSLNELMEKVKSLYHLSGYSAEVMALRDQKSAQLNKEIDRLVTRIQNLDAEIEAVTNARKATDLRDELLKTSARYRESDHRATVEKAVERLGRLREFFGEAEQLSQRRIQSPEEAGGVYTKADEIRENYRAVLAGTHHLLVDKAKAEIEKRVSGEEDKAIAWLNGCKDEMQPGHDISRLMQKLSSPPAFLPAAAQPDLDQLRLRLQEQIDNDAILKIEATFRTIADPKRQEVCLQRLVQLMAEQPSAVGSL